MLKITTDNIPQVEQDLNRSADELLIKQKRILEYGAERIASRASTIVRQTTSGSGTLAQAIMAEPATLKGDTVEVDVVWGVAHGPLVEYGPEIKQWTISAVFARALRWVSGGAVHYAKHVLHTWDPSHLRPHINPAVDELEPLIVADMLDAIQETIGTK